MRAPSLTLGLHHTWDFDFYVFFPHHCDARFHGGIYPTITAFTWDPTILGYGATPGPVVSP